MMGHRYSGREHGSARLSPPPHAQEGTYNVWTHHAAALAESTRGRACVTAMIIAGRGRSRGDRAEIARRSRGDRAEIGRGGGCAEIARRSPSICIDQRWNCDISGMNGRTSFGVKGPIGSPAYGGMMPSRAGTEPGTLEE